MSSYDIKFHSFIAAEVQAIKHYLEECNRKNTQEWVKLYAKEFKTKWGRSLCKTCKHRHCHYKVKAKCTQYEQNSKTINYDHAQTESKKQKRNSCKTVSTHRKNSI
jgi:hypothetical protein